MRAYKYKSAFNELYDFEGFNVCGFLQASDKMEVYLKRTRITGICPVCKKQRRKVSEICLRTVRDLDVSGKRCYIRFESYHINCSCGYSGMEQLDFLKRYDRYTKRFSEFVALLCQKMSLCDVAKITRINWKTAKRIDKEKLKELVIDLKTISPKRIGVDEIAYEKGHKYLTIVRDLDYGVIWVGKDRRKETLEEFFDELGKEKSVQITVAVIDMWDPYIKSIKENTIAEIVFDKFHVAKKINEVVDKIRKKEFAKADEQERKLMKHKRFLILSRQEKLDEEDKESLKNLMKQNTVLYAAYLLKEQGLDIFSEEDQQTAVKRLERWIENVANAQIKEFEETIKVITRYFYGIVNYFKYNLTNAASEGYNTKISVIKRRAYGFRDLEYFKLKILQSCH